MSLSSRGSWHQVKIQVDDFLSSAECTSLIELAKLNGLNKAAIKRDLEGSNFGERFSAAISIADEDDDGFINTEEFSKLIEFASASVVLGETDVRLMWRRLRINHSYERFPEEITSRLHKSLVLPENAKVPILASALQSLSTRLDVLQDLLEDLSRQSSISSRNSRVTLFDKVSTIDTSWFRSLINRLSVFTQLSTDLIEQSEMQIGHYSVGQYYHAHVDSMPHSNAVPCSSPSRVCRFATVLLYLNDVQSGGETAFIDADEDTPPTTLGRMHNLHEHCGDRGITVGARRGRAVLWYNHDVETDGSLGELDLYTYHGGCSILVSGVCFSVGFNV